MDGAHVVVEAFVLETSVKGLYDPIREEGQDPGQYQKMPDPENGAFVRTKNKFPRLMTSDLNISEHPASKRMVCQQLERKSNQITVGEQGQHSEMLRHQSMLATFATNVPCITAGAKPPTRPTLGNGDLSHGHEAAWYHHSTQECVIKASRVLHLQPVFPVLLREGNHLMPPTAWQWGSKSCQALVWPHSHPRVAHNLVMEIQVIAPSSQT
ncbi:hypothetical protein BYT27DRAFT_7240071 [Phlegmacium glaucopus]|nr:hypothetical protein BYT27DRAFT_7240071 [Phlegmacium glaucopus]